MTRQEHPGGPIEQLRSAITSLDPSLLEPVLAEDVQFASCVGRPQVVEHLSRIMSSGVAPALADIEVHRDRAIVSLELTSPDRGHPPLGGSVTSRSFSSATVRSLNCR